MVFPSPCPIVYIYYILIQVGTSRGKLDRSIRWKREPKIEGTGGESMRKQRRKIGGEFKAKVALAAVRGDRTINEVAAAYEVHPNQVSTWKRQLQESIGDIFSDRRVQKQKKEEENTAGLYEQIGRLKVQLDWLKKKVGDVD
jgi:transposase-like protein